VKVQDALYWMIDLVAEAVVVPRAPAGGD